MILYVPLPDTTEEFIGGVIDLPGFHGEFVRLSSPHASRAFASMLKAALTFRWATQPRRFAKSSLPREGGIRQAVAKPLIRQVCSHSISKHNLEWYQKPQHDIRSIYDWSAIGSPSESPKI
jgi:hypothetical protein